MTDFCKYQPLALFVCLLLPVCLDAKILRCCDEIRKGKQEKFETNWYDTRRTTTCLLGSSTVQLSCSPYPNYKVMLHILEEKSGASIAYDGLEVTLHGKPSFKYSLDNGSKIAIKPNESSTSQLRFTCDYANNSRMHYTPMKYIRFTSTAYVRQPVPCPTPPKLRTWRKRSYVPDGNTVSLKCYIPRVGHLGVRFEGKYVFGFGVSTRDELKLSRQDLEDQIAPYHVDVTNCSTTSQSCCQIKASVKLRNDSNKQKATLHFMCFSDSDNFHVQQATSITWFPPAQFNGTEVFTIDDNATDVFEIMPPHPVNGWILTNYGIRIEEGWMLNNLSLSQLRQAIKNRIVKTDKGLKIRKSGLVLNGNVTKVYRLVSVEDGSTIQSFAFPTAVDIKSSRPLPMYGTHGSSCGALCIISVVVCSLILIISVTIIIYKRFKQSNRYFEKIRTISCTENEFTSKV